MLDVKKTMPLTLTQSWNVREKNQMVIRNSTRSSTFITHKKSLLVHKYIMMKIKGVKSTKSLMVDFNCSIWCLTDQESINCNLNLQQTS